MKVVRCGAFWASLVVSTAAAVAQSAPTLADGPLQQQLEQSARKLAGLGLGDAATELAERLADFGADAARVGTLKKALADAAAKVKAPKTTAPDVAKAVRKTAAALAARLAALPVDDRVRAANALLLLDAGQAAAHEALGRVLVDGAWRPADATQRLHRRAEIEDAMRRARRLPVTLAATASDEPLLRGVLGRDGVCVRGHGLEIHGSWSEPQLLRIVGEALRALALGNWVMHGQLDIPKGLQPARWILLKSKVDYERAVDAAAATRPLQTTVAEAKAMRGFYGYRDFFAVWDPTEGATKSGLVAQTSPRLSLPWITAGHINRICLTAFGTRLPVYEVQAAKDGRLPAGTSASPAAVAERERFLRFVDAGLLGSRTWMTHLVDQNQDPALSRAFVDQLGKLAGDDLCKATLVIDFLLEAGPMPRAFVAEPVTELAVPAQIAFVERALGEPLAQFEERWRDSLRTPRPSLVERLDPPKPSGDPRMQQALGHLGALRRAALQAANADEILDVEPDPSLSRGAQLHADYLAKHPAQLEAWPDAHEEYPDREGFTAAGAWGGLHSVIAPEAKSPVDAIDSWMGTFYHRVPLLEPGLLRIGYGANAAAAVLDASSLSAPRPYRSLVLWPYDGMKNVPLRFEPELPDPVPGADQTRCGYPVTLMLGDWSAADGGDPRPGVRVTLHAGASAAAPEVPCHLSTPSAPTNPELAPADTWCLIPKAPLQKASTYTIVVRIPGEPDRVSRFKT